MSKGKKIFVKKGDNVMVIAGESKGQQGKVLVVDAKKQKVIIEGINLVTKHAKPNAENPQGGIVKKEAPMNISNLMLVDGAGNVTRVGRKIDEKTGNLVRYSKKSGEVIK
ncbi:MAG: 50S ribosomal protein L24 [Bacteroidetes bacterium 4484_276]|nr:MAG: 50S ribosomal protein L24 [Bacteroidetes bacterium 4484_276]OYT14391.1 MAG: 50S ribosomal protein L24 [Bacteroidetes bacterium 4572_114]